MIEKLKELAEKNGIYLSGSQLELFGKYLDFLSRWNRVYNLTSVRRKEEIITKHFLDSLSLVKLFETAKIDIVGKKIADLGSGGGFPGVPLKIYYGDAISLYLIEAVQKKCIFLDMLRMELGIDYTVLCQRAEKIKEEFDIVVSRAAGDTFEVLKWAKGITKDGGYIVIMKGKHVEEELRPHTVSLKLYGLPERKFIVLQKKSV